MTAPYYADGRVTLWHGDALTVLPTLPDCSVDAVCTDPPYEYAFMGRAWDASGIAYRVDLWEQALRVLKPGGHLLAFGGTRTWHRLTCAIEDAGFEIRDTITWLYGSGFPKSLDVGKAIDKAAGIWRGRAGDVVSANGSMSGGNYARADKGDPATVDAARWQGWGTALKPASEPVVVARKPLTGTVAATVLEYGTGALNIDATRVGAPEDKRAAGTKTYQRFDPGSPGKVVQPAPHDGLGRWPANVVLTHPQAFDGGDACADGCVPGCPVADLDAQSGTLTSGANPTRRGSDKFRDAYGDFRGQEECTPARGVDVGGASRFFPTFRYQAKADTAQRPRVRKAEGSEERVGGMTTTRCVGCGRQRVNVGSSACTCPEPEFVRERVEHIAHPTVKPLDLMRWLVRLVTPPGGTVLDLFAGSGTTGEACTLEGFRALLVEREADYLPLIVDRLTRRSDPVAHLTAKARRGEAVDLGLFADLEEGA